MNKHFPFSIYHLPFSWKISRGLSLVEILVVVSIFAVLGVLVTRSVILTLQGSKKSESLVSVRENLDYAMNIIERQVRNANSVDCVNSTATNLAYMDSEGDVSNFSCIGLGNIDSYIASRSARLTSDNVYISGCTFSCKAGTSTDQPYVDVNLKAQSSTITGAQGSAVTTATRIYLRNY